VADEHDEDDVLGTGLLGESIERLADLVARRAAGDARVALPSG
jgi:hypothetical protein